MVRNNKLNKKVNGVWKCDLKTKRGRGACRPRRCRAGHWIIIPEESALKDNNNNNNVVRRSVDYEGGTAEEANFGKVSD